MKFMLSILFISILLFSCTNRHTTVYNPSAKGFILSDSMTSRHPYFKKYEADDGGYPVYYIGKRLDTIPIGNRYLRSVNKLTANRVDYATFSFNGLDIFVDTTIKVNIENYHAFLVVIKNKADTSILLGKTFALSYLYREIKNSRGKWIKVEQMISEMNICGSGQPYIILQPENLILAKAVRYAGSDLAECRLVMKHGPYIAYSNAFFDSIPSSLKK